MAFEKRPVESGEVITAEWANHIQTQYKEALDWGKAFGLGSDVENVDWNTVNKTGFYSGDTNGPNSATVYGVHVQRSETEALQQAGRGDRTYFRTKQGGTFSEWKEVETVEGAQEKADAVDSEQVNIVPNYGPNADVEMIGRGVTVTRVSGSVSTPLLAEWLENMGFEASDFGRDIESLRLTVTTFAPGFIDASAGNTGYQKAVLFAWDANPNNYETYAILHRSSNTIAGETTPWGKWHEEVFVFNKGSNSNGDYIMYSDGIMECFCYVGGVVADVSSGNIFRSETVTVHYPAEFEDMFIESRAVSATGTLRWADVTGLGTTSSSNVRHYSTVDSSTSIGVRLYVKGRWRRERRS